MSLGCLLQSDRQTAAAPDLAGPAAGTDRAGAPSIISPNGPRTSLGSGRKAVSGGTRSGGRLGVLPAGLLTGRLAGRPGEAQHEQGATSRPGPHAKRRVGAGLPAD